MMLYLHYNKTRVILPLILLLLAACARKHTPVITERKSGPPKSVVTPYPPPGMIVPDTATGRMLFTGRCGRCHGLPEPFQYTSQRWESILSSMIPRARLNKTEAVHIKTYLHGQAAN